jgi:hypothetical protein
MDVSLINVLLLGVDVLTTIGPHRMCAISCYLVIFMTRSCIGDAPQPIAQVITPKVNGAALKDHLGRIIILIGKF